MKDSRLHLLRKTNMALQMHKNFLDKHVAQARGDGCTWKQIGDTLGVSKQAAQQRYGRHGNKITSTEIQ